jgi:hypothetical protein
MKELKQILSPGYISTILFAIILSTLFTLPAQSQPELMAWGNLTGIRVQGQLMEFESSLRVVDKGWLDFNATGREKQDSKYDREGQKQTVTTSIGGIVFSKIVEDSGLGQAEISVKTTSETNTLVEGAFLCIDLPDKYYSEASALFINSSSEKNSKLNLADINADNNSKPIKVISEGVVIESSKQQLEINFDTKETVFIRKDPGSTGIQVYIELLRQRIRKGQEITKTFNIRVYGIIDDSPVEIILDTQNPGSRFEEFGGDTFGTKRPLLPTERIWNLKQLASTPEDAFAIPTTCNRQVVNCVAFGNKTRGEYAIHIVNNGAECQASVKGLPSNIKTLEVYVTDNVKGMEKTGEIKVVDGIAKFKLHKIGFTSLINKK